LLIADWGVRGRTIDPLIVSVFNTFIAERKLHAYILLYIFCEEIFLATDKDTGWREDTYI
jgi:hypothetical protein